MQQLPSALLSSVKRAAAPAVSSIRAAPHRDVAHIPFPVLYQLYLSGLLSMRQGAGDTTQDARACFGAVLDEWCLRSVFSDKWSDVAIDEDRVVSFALGVEELSASAAERQSQSLLVEQCSAKAKPPSTAETTKSIVLTTSTFVGTQGPESHREQVEGFHYLERFSNQLQDELSAQRRRTNAAPSSSRTSTSKSFVVIPYSTLHELRAVMYQSPAMSFQSASSVKSTTKLIQHIMCVQQHTVAFTPRCQLIVVPPSQEFELISRLARGQTFTLGQLCKSSLLRWAAASGLSTAQRAALFAERTALLGASGEMELCVTGKDQVNVVAAAGGRCASRESITQVFGSAISTALHRAVTSQCADMARRLAAREQSLMSSVRR